MSLKLDIKTIVEQQPIVASEIYTMMEKKGYRREAVKVEVSRLVKLKQIYRSKLNLSHNNSILAKENNFTNPILLRDLINKDFYGRHALTNLVKHIIEYCSSVSLVDVAKLAVLRIGKEPELDWTKARDLIASLEELGFLIKRSEDDRWFLNKELLKIAQIKFNNKDYFQSNIAIIENLRKLLAQAISEWLSNQGFVSFNGNQIINESRPVISGYGLAFDFLGYCFLNGVIKRTKGKKPIPLPVLGDVQVGVCNLAYAKSFKLRITEVASTIKQVPMGFVLAKGFDKEAFKYLKREGILALTVDGLFGKQPALAVESIIEISREIAKNNINTEQIATTIDNIDAFGGPLGNLKGQIFEVMIAYFVSCDGYGNTQIGKKVPQTENDKLYYELDVLGIKNRDAIILECKGIGKDKFVDEVEVTKHFKKRTTAARKYFLKNSTSIKVENFESILVTTGGFSKETIENFKKYKKKEDTNFEIWDRETLISKLKNAGHTSIVGIINKYF